MSLKSIEPLSVLSTYQQCTGEQQVAEFLANVYLDVYIGHVNTLKHIRDHRPGAFHLMMADIYIKAK